MKTTQWVALLAKVVLKLWEIYVLRNIIWIVYTFFMLIFFNSSQAIGDRRLISDFHLFTFLCHHSLLRFHKTTYFQPIYYTPLLLLLVPLLTSFTLNSPPCRFKQHFNISNLKVWVERWMSFFVSSTWTHFWKALADICYFSGIIFVNMAKHLYSYKR